MTGNDLFQMLLYIGVLLLAAYPLGAFMARVLSGEPTWIGRFFGPIERVTYRVAGIDPTDEMTWGRYATAAMVFNVAGLLVVYAYNGCRHGCR